MKLNIWQRGLLVVLVVGVALAFGSIQASANHDPFPSAPTAPLVFPNVPPALASVGGITGNGYVQDQCHDFSLCGYNGPLIWNPYTVVASSIAWTTKHWEVPVMHATRRGSELSQNDVVDPICFDELISGNGRVNDGIVDPIYGGPYKAPYTAWPVPEAQWIATFPASADINTPCSNAGSGCDPTVPAGTNYPNVLANNNPTTRIPPIPDNYGVSHNAPVNSQGGGLTRCERSSYKQLMYGGYNQRQGQYLNLPVRVRTVYDRNFPGSLVWDFTNPVAFSNGHGDVRVIEANAAANCPQAVDCTNWNVSKRDSEILSDIDAQGNANAWSDAGFSKGLGNNLYSLGLAVQANGLLSEIGGHNMQSNTGFRKMNIFNIETNSWYPRPHPCQRTAWEADRYGKLLGYTAVADAVAGAGPGGGESLVNPPGIPLAAVDAPVFPLSICDQHNKAQADPEDPSDMRYWRWYPAASMLPNGLIVTYGGDDRDTTAPACLAAACLASGDTVPTPTTNTSIAPTSDPSVANYNNREPGLNNSTIQVPVMDVWDPNTDTQTALENARKVYPLYPMSAAMETGPGWDDWQFCTVGGESAPANQAPLPRNSALDESTHWRDFCSLPGCAADTRTIVSGAGGIDGSALDCLDILAALADPNVNVPAENYWGLHTRAHNRYPYSNPMVDMTYIGANGKTTSHKLFLFGGTQPTGVGDPFAGTTGRLIEVIELSDGFGGPAGFPTWTVYGKLVQSTSASHALALADGNIYSSGGGGAGAAGNFVNCATENIGGPCHFPQTTYEGAVNLRNQIVCLQPASYCQKGVGSVQIVGQMTVPRAGIHGTYHLLNTGEALQSAFDRTAISRSGNRIFSPGDSDLAISSTQIFTPPYLYDAAYPCPTSIGCRLAQRPIIKSGPDIVNYGDKMSLKVNDLTGGIKLVSLIRSGSATHTLAQDQVYVQLPFKATTPGPAGNFTMTITAPVKPVQAKPGDYQLFVVNMKGTPSLAKHVRIQSGGRNKNYVHLFTKKFPAN